jgi:hypothetical protein
LSEKKKTEKKLPTEPELVADEVRLTPLAVRLLEVSTRTRNKALADARKIAQDAEAEHARNVEVAAKESGKALPDGVRVEVEEKAGAVYLTWKAPAPPKQPAGPAAPIA